MDEFEPLKIERIDDVPVLLAQLERIQVANLLNQHFPTHGNWQGLSLGTVSVVWPSHVLSEETTYMKLCNTVSKLTKRNGCMIHLFLR
jgi:transposase